MTTKMWIIVASTLVVIAQAGPDFTGRYGWISRTPPEHSLGQRIPPPAGFHHVPVAPGGFAHWLRSLPLKPGKPDVMLFDGSRKGNQSAHVAVVDIDVGGRDLQQCADAVIRLRAEYLYQTDDRSKICFHFTDGSPARFTQWSAGYRPRVSPSGVRWLRTAAEDDSYGSFRRYLDTVFTYAGTISLNRELRPLSPPGRAAMGDVFIEAGSPGHAVIVVGAAENGDGRRLFLLAQSYMPAQEIHVLKNPGNQDLSPWYDADFGEVLTTPEWVFARRHLKRF